MGDPIPSGVDPSEDRAGVLDTEEGMALASEWWTQRGASFPTLSAIVFWLNERGYRVTRTVELEIGGSRG